MDMRLSVYALALDPSRCVVCFEVFGDVEPVAVTTQRHALQRGFAVVRGREGRALRLTEALAAKEAQRAIDAARGKP
ncbi:MULTISPECIES: hypothetical protein [Tepidimonas]|uniref:Uncharacterized protein n=2 Tax=Tepidimonas TaxID=114248 RepID=A0A554X8B6_9BURK|nr:MULTISPECIES: hypothetical protein [Tepidimonas]TCS94090.1 hypothetical protein EDC36_12012 [Tepidimonas ignava]TSE18916.1 hypothetical protein Tigna_02363 [Tepidimonas ignava]TSE32078.1 hypothetical protein Tchar_02164 [Tepidimonas charontis]